MNTYADKRQEKESQGVANSLPKLQSNSKSTFQLVDNRSEAIAQRKLQEASNNSPRVQQLKAYQEMGNNSQQVKHMTDNFTSHTAQRKENLEEETPEGKFEPIQKKENNTGLPNNLKSGIESLSGYSMDDVKVNYNSDKPAQLHAHAYAQSADIHLGAGQEKHLPHEAWHVVQQKQGRVKPTMQMKGMVNVNDDAGLEKEADVMGEKAFQMKISHDDMKDVGRTKQEADKNNTPLFAKSAQLQNSVISKNNSTVQLIKGFSAFLPFGKLVAEKIPLLRTAAAQFPKVQSKIFPSATKKPEMFGGGMTRQQYLRSGLDDEATLGVAHSGTSYKLNPQFYDQSQQDSDKPWEGRKWPKKKDGTPSDGGVEGTHEVITFKEGEILDRFGGETGNFLGQNGARFEDRSISDYDVKYTKYAIIKSFQSTKSEVLPWFGFKGGGIQYKTEDSVEKLVIDGFIKPVE